MIRYKVVHVTRFEYDGPVSESYNELRLRPRHDEGQSCLSFRLTTDPASRPTAHLDYLGNWVHRFQIFPEHRRLQVEAEAVVLVHPVERCETSLVSLNQIDEMRQALLGEHYDLLAASRYCPHLPELLDYVRDAEAASGGVAQGFAEAAVAIVHNRFQYRKGATHVHSSIADSIESGEGVCQDFSHLLLAILRMRGLPSRYVSGYLVPRPAAGDGDNFEQVVGGMASHAWTEALIPGHGWIGLDPTLGGRTGLQHVRVAYGRDYGDVPPVRGVYRGHAGQSLYVDVLVRPAVDDEGAELLLETSAAPPPTPESEYQQQQHQQQ